MRKENLEDIQGVYTEDIVRDLDQLIKLKEQFEKDVDINGGDKWVFRGQDSVIWELKSTFERSKPDTVLNVPAWKFEAAILREFTRRAHHYISDTP